MPPKPLAARTGAGLRSALAALALAPALAAPAHASPAMWVARDADSTVYLLGTIHVLDPEADWQTPAILKGLAEADELWLEIDFAGDRTAGFASIARLGTSPDRTLLGRLTPRERDDLTAVAADVGLSVNTMQGMRPWLAAMVISLGAARKAGLTETGVDQWLAGTAAADGKPLKAFETGAEQIAIFADLTEAQELDMLRSTVETLRRDGPEAMRRVFEVWRSGDLDKIAAETDRDIRAAGPAIYDRFLTDRNRRFAAKIEAVMKGSGTSFVAVGAAHFAGSGSVLEFLEQAGITAERVE